MTEKTLETSKWLHDGQGWITVLSVTLEMYESKDYVAARSALEAHAEREFAAVDGMTSGWKLDHGSVTLEYNREPGRLNFYARLESTIRKKEAQA